MLSGEEFDVFAVCLLRAVVSLPQEQRLAGFDTPNLDLLVISRSALLGIQSEAGLAAGHRQINVGEYARIEQRAVQTTVTIIDIVTLA